MNTRFTVGTTIGGYEVVDRDGRPISPSFDVLLASRLCKELNEAAQRGRATLARALGAVELYG